MIVASIAVPAMFAYLALTNDRGLRLFSIVVLSVSQGTVFYWAVGGITLLAALVGVLSVFHQSKAHGYIELRTNGAFVPGYSLKQEMFELAYPSIRSVQVIEIHRNRFLDIRSTAGRSRLMMGAFQSEQKFAEFHVVLLQRCAIRM